MCVILSCKTGKPSLEVLTKCEQANTHGGGVAFRVGERVRYVKGLSAANIHELITPAAVALPIVIHFRQASVSGASPDLCHPFVINRYATAKLDGYANRVLFHNGHWSDWRDWCLKFALNAHGAVPFGTWSDTRALAWALHHKGEGLLNLINGGKFCVMSLTGVRHYGDGWTEEDGIKFSNTQWKYRYNSVNATNVCGLNSNPVGLNTVHTQQQMYQGCES